MVFRHFIALIILLWMWCCLITSTWKYGTWSRHGTPYWDLSSIGMLHYPSHVVDTLCIVYTQVKVDFRTSINVLVYIKLVVSKKQTNKWNQPNKTQVSALLYKSKLYNILFSAGHDIDRTINTVLFFNSNKPILVIWRCDVSFLGIHIGHDFKTIYLIRQGQVQYILSE